MLSDSTDNDINIYDLFVYLYTTYFHKNALFKIYIDRKLQKNLYKSITADQLTPEYIHSFDVIADCIYQKLQRFFCFCFILCCFTLHILPR